MEEGKFLSSMCLGKWSHLKGKFLSSMCLGKWSRLEGKFLSSMCLGKWSRLEGKFLSSMCLGKWSRLEGKFLSSMCLGEMIPSERKVSFLHVSWRNDPVWKESFFPLGKWSRLKCFKFIVEGRRTLKSTCKQFPSGNVLKDCWSLFYLFVVKLMTPLKIFHPLK